MSKKRNDVIFKTKKVGNDDLLAYVEWTDGPLDSLKNRPSWHGCEIGIVIDGAITHIFNDDEKVETYSGEISLLNFMESHRVVTSERGSIFGYCFRVEDKNIATGKNHNLFKKRKIEGGIIQKNFSNYDFYKEIVSWIKDESEIEQSKINSYFLELLSTVMDISTEDCINVSKQEEANLNKVRDFIEKNYSSDITVEQLAKMQGKSKFYFIRLFRKNFGTTPIEYLHNIRMNAAMRLIVSTTKNIDQIAYDVGFNDLSFFTNKFKRLFGKSPSSLRK